MDRFPQNERHPTTPFFTTDAAWDGSTKQAGLAWILHDPHSEVPRQGSQIIRFVSSPLMAEALVLLKGVESAAALGIPRVNFYSDCSTLIRAINSKQHPKEIFGPLQDIDRLSSAFSIVSFQHFPRSQNRKADDLAKWTLKAHSHVVSFH